jgi:hypothetical protein
MDIILLPVFYLKHVSDNGLCFRLQAEPVNLGTINRANFYLWRL